MIQHRLLKPDGRPLLLYARAPFDPGTAAPVPAGGRTGPRQSHLRWHPLRGEWVVYASHRQERTFLPPPEWDPLAPTTDPAHPSELPSSAWEVAVFENLFPALSGADTVTGNPEDALAAHGVVPQAPAGGTCEVVVFTPDARGSLSTLPLAHLELILEVWGQRQQELGTRPDVAYVFPFENRGVEVGVTLPHPHGQIYAYPFVPPAAARELEQQQRHLARHGRGLLVDLVRAEREDGRRVSMGVRFPSPALAAAWKGCAGWGGLPGLAGAAVGTADRGGDLRLEAVSALAPVQGLILRCRGALGAEALRGSQVLGGRARVTPAGASGDLGSELHRTVFDRSNAELA